MVPVLFLLVLVLWFSFLPFLQSSMIYKLYQESIVHAHLLDKRHAKLIKALLKGKFVVNSSKVSINCFFNSVGGDTEP